MSAACITAQALAELGDVLPMLQLFEQVALRALLLMRHRFEHAMAIEQPHDLVEALCQPDLRMMRWHDGHRSAGA